MILKTFKPGGIHINNHKKATERLPIEWMKDPEFVVIPMSQHFFEPATPIVNEGDIVKIGQKIGKASSKRSSNIHASVSGEVINIGLYPHPTEIESLAIKIKNNNLGDWFLGINEEKSNPLYEKEQIINSIWENGIVGLGGAAFPTHIKLSPPPNTPIDTLIINGSECEPYLTCDNRIMIENTKQILAGIKIIVKTLPFMNVYIGIERQNQEAIHMFHKELSISPIDSKISVVVLKERYPQGAEKNLIQAITKKVVPVGKLPYHIGIVVQNVATVLAIYEAINWNKPLIERVITVAGDCIQKPKNLKVKIGTQIKDIVDFCGGLTKDPNKIIFGGPMMGISQRSFDSPIIKGCSGVLFFSKDLETREQNCIRCGKCIQNCPSGLMPLKIVEFSKANDFESSNKYDASSCIECGLCSYNCPAKINLLNYIRIAKIQLQKWTVKR
jgi:Na+-translocating ferredoxin:NAD+ oxidoreductase subunit C